MNNEYDFPILQTDRLLLRPFKGNDLENIFKGLSHPDVIKYYGISYSTLEAAKAQLTFFAGLEATGTGRWWAICSIDNTVFYGGCGLNNLEQQHQKAEIGFWLLPEYWGNGIVPEAAALVCNYGFVELGLHRIEAVIESENSNSKKVMARMQFNYEGTLKECENKNGRFISLDRYAKLKTPTPAGNTSR